MKSPDNNRYPPDHDFRNLCGKLLDRGLAEFEQQQFNRMLLESGNARRYYVEMIAMHASLRSRLVEWICSPKPTESESRTVHIHSATGIGSRGFTDSLTFRCNTWANALLGAWDKWTG